MKAINRFAQTVFEPMGGVQQRTFLADYKDGNGESYHQTHTLLLPPGSSSDDNEAVEAIRRTLTAQGYTFVSVVELLDGYSAEQLERMKRDEAAKHMRLLFLSLDASDL